MHLALTPEYAQRIVHPCPERSAAHPAQPAGATGDTMKSVLITAVAFAALVTPALADSKVANCTGVASMAKSAMELRQTGADLPALIGALSKELDGADLAVAIEVLQIAYSEPLYSSERAKQGAANEFSSKMFLACMEVEA